jgi:RNA polymerase sigma factor (sigma-70 family)
MTEQPQPYIQMLQACEAAIGRIRIAIRTGNGDSSEVSEDFAFVRQSVKPSFTRFAVSMKNFAPDAKEEARQAMFDQLEDHIRSLNYPTLETRFGAYLKRTPLRAIYKTQKNYTQLGQIGGISRLDAKQNDDGYTLGDITADPRAEAAFDTVLANMVVKDACAQLSNQERQVIAMIWYGYSNKEVAQRLAISPSKVTRLRQRAGTHLQQYFNNTDE